MQRLIAEKLLEMGAVALSPSQPFVWTSGMKSPIYCDNRLTMSDPIVRKEIAKGMQSVILDYFPEAEVLAGTATAGIPHAAWTSDLMELPMCYVRSKAKGHGKGNQIEGKIAPGQKVVVIEDLISTGGSVITAVEALREAGCLVLGVLSIFTYELKKGKNQLDSANIEAHSLTTYKILIETAAEKGILSADELESLYKWQQDPENWLSEMKINN